MKTNILLTWVIWLLATVTIGCSDDDDRTMFIKDGKVHYMGAVLNYEPVDIKDLPEWLLKAHPSIEKDEIGQILCKGIWEGKITYLYNAGWTLARIDGKEFEEAGGWEAWTCIYFKPIIPD